MRLLCNLVSYRSYKSTQIQILVCHMTSHWNFYEHYWRLVAENVNGMEFAVAFGFWVCSGGQHGTQKIEEELQFSLTGIILDLNGVTKFEITVGRLSV